MTCKIIFSSTWKTSLNFRVQDVKEPSLKGCYADWYIRANVLDELVASIFKIVQKDLTLVGLPSE
jgi:hypothetical protein